MDSLNVDQRVKDLENAVSEMTIGIDELIELAQSRTVAIAIAATLNGDRIHLDVVRDKLEGGNTDRFRHIQRVSVGNEELHADVTDRRIEDHIGDQIIVWRSDGAESGEAVYYQDGLETLSTAIAESK